MKQKTVTAWIGVIAFLYLMTILLAFANCIVYPQFSKIPVIFTMFFGAGVAIYKGYPSETQARLQGGLILSVTLLTAFLLQLAFWFGNPRQRHQEYPSPNGEKVLVMEFDFMDRPSLYLKHGLFMQKLYKPNQVYNETITYKINWLDNDIIELVNLTYPDTRTVVISIDEEK